MTPSHHPTTPVWLSFRCLFKDIAKIRLMILLPLPRGYQTEIKGMPYRDDYKISAPGGNKALCGVMNIKEGILPMDQINVGKIP